MRHKGRRKALKVANFCGQVVEFTSNDGNLWIPINGNNAVTIRTWNHRAPLLVGWRLLATTCAQLFSCWRRRRGLAPGPAQWRWDCQPQRWKWGRLLLHRYPVFKINKAFKICMYMQRFFSYIWLKILKKSVGNLESTRLSPKNPCIFPPKNQPTWDNKHCH